jgi:hypothetical protein
MAGDRDRSFKKLEATAVDLRAASKDRLEDARILAAAGHPASAIAAGLYALEIFLKVLICQRLDLPALPKAFEIHDLEALLILSGLSQRLAGASHIRFNWDQILIPAQKLEELRYLPEGSQQLPIGARNPQDAVTFLARLDDPNDGVLTWLSSQP